VLKDRKRKINKRLVLLIMLALGIRFALINLNHPLDLQTWHGLFVDLNQNRSPYTTFEELTYEARATQGVGWSQYYMYFAYPPMLIPVYYPLAKLYGVFYPNDQVNFSIADVDPYPQVPLLLNFLFKLPIILADIGIALLLYKMTKGSEKSLISYLFNPLVIFVSAAWMFDSIAAFFLVLALYLFERRRYDFSAVALSFGFLTKIFPIFALPVFCIEFIRRKSWKFVRYALIFGAVAALVTLPFWSGVKLSFEYHSARQPSGLTPLSIHFVAWAIGASESTLNQLEFVILPAVGSFFLIAGMSLIYAYLSKKEISLRQKLLMTFIVYFIVSKNLHEPHILTLIPFCILELHERCSFDKKWQYRLLWMLAFAYAIIGAPLTRFLYGYTLDMGILYLFELPMIVKGVILAGVVVTFHLILWNALITLIRGRPVVSLEGLRQRLKR